MSGEAEVAVGVTRRWVTAEAVDAIDVDRCLLIATDVPLVRGRVTRVERAWTKLTRSKLLDERMSNATSTSKLTTPALGNRPCCGGFGDETGVASCSGGLLTCCANVLCFPYRLYEKSDGGQPQGIHYLSPRRGAYANAGGISAYLIPCFCSKRFSASSAEASGSWAVIKASTSIW